MPSEEARFVPSGGSLLVVRHDVDVRDRHFEATLSERHQTEGKQERERSKQLAVFVSGPWLGTCATNDEATETLFFLYMTAVSTLGLPLVGNMMQASPR